MNGRTESTSSGPSESYLKCLHGSPFSGGERVADEGMEMKVRNRLPVELGIYENRSGTARRIGAILPTLDPDEPTSGVVRVTAGGPISVTALPTGGLVTVVEELAPVLEIDFATFQLPNRIGAPPEPELSASPPVLLPQGTARAVVGAGVPEAENNVMAVLREQFWQCTGDSYSLAPGEEATHSTTRVIGVTTTSSTSEAVAESLGLSASAGWGPVSMSINAMVSRNSTTTQQTTVSESTTTYENRVIKGIGDTPTMVLKWQLIDVYSILHRGVAVHHMFSVAQDPPVTRGPYVLVAP